MRALIATFGLKRLGVAAAAAVSAGLIAVAAMAFLIPADTVREAVKAQIRAVTGLQPNLRGSVSVSLFPYGMVRFGNVVLGDDRYGQAPLTADQLTARLRFFPLLLGRIEISDVSLVRPRILVGFEYDGHSNWSTLIESLARELRPASDGGPASFSEIRIDDGTFVLRDEAHGVTETLSGAQLSLAWPSISKTFAATGRFNWRNEPIDIAVTLGDFMATLSGQRSGLKVRVTGAPAKFAFDGSVSMRPSLKLEGTLAADAASLRDTLRWTGQKPLPGGGFGRFALKAQTSYVGGTLSMSQVNVELDGNAAEGVLSVSGDNRQAVQATLAADAIDLSPYVSTIRLLAGGERDWSRVPIQLDGLTGFDVDLRLSAAKVTVGNAKLGRTAVSANLRGGRLSLTIGESQAFGGMLTGSLALAKAPGGADFKTQIQFTDVDLESCLSEVFAVKRLEGRGNLALALEGSGSSVAAITRTLNGAASLTGSQGALSGLNVEQLLRRLERRPLSGGGEFRTGRTPYDKLLITLKVTQGTATVENVTLEGSAVRLALVGSASIPERDLDLKGKASLVSANTAVTFELPFVVQGPWDSPLMLPDPESLIRRSGAAAPLLDAVRERRGREAVRSLIDRLTGGVPILAPAPASAPGATGTAETASDSAQ